MIKKHVTDFKLSSLHTKILTVSLSENRQLKKKNTIKDGRKQVLIKQYESLVILTKLPYII